MTASRKSPRGWRPVASTVLRWTLPTLVLFAVLALLAWKIARTEATPFVYDLGF